MDKLFNLAADGIPEILINRNIDNYKANEIAEELFNTVGKHVRFRINSFGGGVYAGYLILSSMQAFQAAGNIIETINMGIADSTAGWLLAGGSKGHRSAYPYARTLVHEPDYDNGVKIDDMPEGKTKQELMDARDAIVMILSSKTGINKNTLRSLMKKEKVFVGSELKDNGFVDKIINIKNSIDIPENATQKEVFEIVNSSKIEEDTDNKNIKTKENRIMKKEIAQKLGLHADASDEVITNAVQSILDDNAKLTKANTAFEEKADSDKTEITNLKKKVTDFESKEHEPFLEQAIEEGRITKESKEIYNKHISTLGFDSVKEMIEALPKKEIYNKSKDLDLVEGKNDENNDDTPDEAKAKSLVNAKKYLDSGMSDESLRGDYIKMHNTSEFQELVNKK